MPRSRRCTCETDGERTARNTAEAAGFRCRRPRGRWSSASSRRAQRATSSRSRSVRAERPPGAGPLGGTAVGRRQRPAQAGHDRAARRGSTCGVSARARPDRGLGLVLAGAALALRAGSRSRNRRGRAAHLRRGIDSRVHRPAAARAAPPGRPSSSVATAPGASTTVRLETRVGRIGELIPLVAAESGCDLIALGWSQELSTVRAPVVHETLARSHLPVLLVPVQLVANLDEALAEASRDELFTSER